MKAVIGIGTNIGDRLCNIKDVLAAFDKVPMTKVKKISRVYETKPWGFADQADFLNCAILIETQLSPQAVLGVCLGTEAALGRIRNIKNGPRIIDLDLLFYEDKKIDTDELCVPHPLISDRTFVLCPLKDLFPDMIIFGFDYSKALEECDKSSAKYFTEL